MCDRVKKYVESKWARNGVLAVILFNSILLGMETSKSIMSAAADMIRFLDRLCLSIYVIEISAKIFAYRLSFFRNGWNTFDCVIVGFSLIPGTAGFAALRALRVLRLLRTVSISPSLRRMVEGFLTALPGMGSVLILMGIMFYIGSVMATLLFGEKFPEWFGSMGASGYTLFQIMTLESWSMGIVRPVMDEYPYAWAFFIPFILVTTFVVVNLLVGLIVNSMQETNAEDKNVVTDAYRDEIMTKLDAIDRRLDRRDSDIVQFNHSLGNIRTANSGTGRGDGRVWVRKV